MTPQSAFMVLAPLRIERIGALRARLESLCDLPGHANPGDPRLPFATLPMLHDARFVVLEAHNAEDMRQHGRRPRPWVPRLQFSGECDGSSDAFFAALVQAGGPMLLDILSHCESPPAGIHELEHWLRDRDVRPAAHYVNRRGRTVVAVRENAALRATLRQTLADAVDEIGLDDPRALRRRLIETVERERAAGRLSLSAPTPTPWRWRLRHGLHFVAGPVALIALSPLLVVTAPVWLLVLRLRERFDPEIVARPEPARDRDMARREDHFVTNQFNEFGDVKPGWFRGVFLRLMLLVTDWFARHVYHRGRLARIRTIHYARWVPIDAGHRLVFTSTYDGSREAYMDDFINKVGWGLNAIFSHCVSYPRTRWLLKEGASRETPFKYGNRRHQLPSGLWYNAYPDRTVIELERDRLVRRGVERRPLTVAGIRRWLELVS